MGWESRIISLRELKLLNSLHIYSRYFNPASISHHRQRRSLISVCKLRTQFMYGNPLIANVQQIKLYTTRYTVSLRGTISSLVNLIGCLEQLLDYHSQLMQSLFLAVCCSAHQFQGVYLVIHWIRFTLSVPNPRLLWDVHFQIID